MSGLDYYTDLLQGSSRLNAFRAAIRAVVRPGDHVLDLGTGLGTYAFFAAQAGAARVWAVDRDPIVNVAAELAAANGLSDRVRVVRGDATDADLPTEVDVLVFEDFPATLLDAGTHALLARAHKALAGEGTMIPRAARLNVAPVHADPVRRLLFPDPVDGTGEDGLGLDWSPLRPLLANHPRRGSIAPAQLLAPPLRSGRVPLYPLPDPGELRVAGAWTATAGTTVHALALWFDLDLAPGVSLSNEPRLRPEPWGQTLLPLDPPLPVDGPSRVEVAVWRERLPSGGPGWLAWEASCAAEVRRGHEFGGLVLGAEEVTGERHLAGGSGYATGT